MERISIKEAAKKWNISERTVQQLCSAGRIEGAEKFGGSWAIPTDAKKPSDPRRAPKDAQAGGGKDSARGEVAACRPERVAMPLLNTPFKPGQGMDAAIRIEDPDSRNIALAEYYYFSGEADRASKIAEGYLSHEDMALRLSACFICAYASLALDRTASTRYAMGIVQRAAESIDGDTPMRDRALAVCISTGASVLLHLPLPKILAPLKDHIHMMPPGLRLFVLYIQAHHSYLNGQYGASIGIAETALALEGESYPIPEIYLHIAAAMGYMNLKKPEQAKGHLLEAWSIAEPDYFIEAFGEHHGLLGGALEATFKKDFPEDFRRMIAITYKFSAGWRKIHNTETGRSVADNLTTTEFAAAMLAARDWTNKEIAAHMGIAENTVKTYIATALQKLNITQRKELREFMLH